MPEWEGGRVGECEKGGGVVNNLSFWLEATQEKRRQKHRANKEVRHQQRSKTFRHNQLASSLSGVARLPLRSGKTYPSEGETSNITPRRVSSHFICCVSPLLFPLFLFRPSLKYRSARIKSSLADGVNPKSAGFFPL